MEQLETWWWAVTAPIDVTHGVTSIPVVSAHHHTPRQPIPWGVTQKRDRRARLAGRPDTYFPTYIVMGNLRLQKIKTFRVRTRKFERWCIVVDEGIAALSYYK